MEVNRINCSICGKDLPDPAFARNYPNFVCGECGARAVNCRHEHPAHNSWGDSGDNPIFIDGRKCWRRYRYGGFITMLDDLDCGDIGEFYDRHGWIG